MYFSFLLFFFLNLPSKEIKSQPWQERVKSLLGIYRLHQPVAIVLRQHTPLWLWGVFGRLPASQRLWLWCVVQAVLGPGCCCCGLGFTHTGCQEGCPVCNTHFHSRSDRPAAQGVCLCAGHKWLSPAALRSCVLLSVSAEAGFAPSLSSRGRGGPLPGGRHQLCQAGCGSAGPPWQGSGEPTQRVEQFPLGTLHWPSFDLGLAAS